MNSVSNKKRIAISLGVVLLTTSCASMQESLLLGAGIGTTAGTGIGLAAQGDATGALIGAGIGLAVGAGMGVLSHKDAEQKDAMLQMFKSRREFPKEKELPGLKAPEVTCYRTSEKVQDEEYLGPQVRCKIEKPAVLTH